MTLSEQIAYYGYDIVKPLVDDCWLVGWHHETDGAGVEVGVTMRDGTEIIPAEWESIEWLPELGLFYSMGDTEDNSLVALFDREGRRLFSEYRLILPVGEFFVVETGTKAGLIHKSGRVIVPAESDHVSAMEAKVGVVPDIFRVKRGESSEFINARHELGKQILGRMPLSDKEREILGLASGIIEAGLRLIAQEDVTQETATLETKRIDLEKAYINLLAKYDDDGIIRDWWRNSEALYNAAVIIAVEGEQEYGHGKPSFARHEDFFFDFAHILMLKYESTE